MIGAMAHGGSLSLLIQLPLVALAVAGAVAASRPLLRQFTGLGDRLLMVLGLGGVAFAWFLAGSVLGLPVRGEGSPQGLVRALPFTPLTATLVSLVTYFLLTLTGAVLGAVILMRPGRWTRVLFWPLVAGLGLTLALQFAGGSLALFVGLAGLILLQGFSTGWVTELSPRQLWLTLGGAVVFFTFTWIMFLDWRQLWGFSLALVVKTFWLAWAAVREVVRLPQSLEGGARLGGLTYFHGLWLCFLGYSGLVMVRVLLMLPAAGLLERRRQQVASLEKLVRYVNAGHSLAETWEYVVETAAASTTAEKAWVVFPEGAVGPAVGLSPAERAGLEALVAGGGYQALLATRDVAHRLHAPRTEVLGAGAEEAGPGAFIAVPMESERIGPVGLLCLWHDIPYSLDRQDRTLAAMAGQHGTIAAEQARFLAALVDKRRIEEEIRIAKGIQERLLPAELPRLPWLAVAARSLPCHEVGGDYFDLLVREDGRLAVTMADVSGKGVAAALIMANLQAGWRLLARETPAPAETTTRLNAMVYENTDPGRFITGVFGLLDGASGELLYCNAGHNPPLLVRADGTVDRLTRGGLSLGIMPEWSYETGRVRLGPGDLLVLYTDGISEAMSPAEEEFGTEALTALLTERRTAPVPELWEAVAAAVRTHAAGAAGQDDMTLALLRLRNGAANVTG